MADVKRIDGLIAGQDQHSFGFCVGKAAIVAPDLRGSRTAVHVMGRDNMSAILDWIDGVGGKPEPPQHLTRISAGDLPITSCETGILRMSESAAPDVQNGFKLIFTRRTGILSLAGAKSEVHKNRFQRKFAHDNFTRREIRT